MQGSVFNNLINYLSTHALDKKNEMDILTEWARCECVNINFTDLPIFLNIIKNIKGSNYPKPLIQKTAAYLGGYR